MVWCTGLGRVGGAVEGEEGATPLMSCLATSTSSWSRWVGNCLLERPSCFRWMDSAFKRTGNQVPLVLSLFLSGSRPHLRSPGLTPASSNHLSKSQKGHGAFERIGTDLRFPSPRPASSQPHPAALLSLPQPQKEHGAFKRIGTDLFFEKTVGLVEALTGAHFHLTHLDERVLEVSAAC